jgi:hypothetical protein
LDVQTFHGGHFVWVLIFSPSYQKGLFTSKDIFKKAQMNILQEMNFQNNVNRFTSMFLSSHSSPEMQMEVIDRFSAITCKEGQMKQKKCSMHQK